MADKTDLLSFNFKAGVISISIKIICDHIFWCSTVRANTSVQATHPTPQLVWTHNSQKEHIIPFYSPPSNKRQKLLPLVPSYVPPKTYTISNYVPKFTHPTNSMDTKLTKWPYRPTKIKIRSNYVSDFYQTPQFAWTLNSQNGQINPFF